LEPEKIYGCQSHLKLQHATLEHSIHWYMLSRELKAIMKSLMLPVALNSEAEALEGG
jgi:hypothetical protein